MLDKLTRIIDDYAFLRPEVAPTPQFIFTYPQHQQLPVETSADSAVPFFNTATSTVKLTPYQLGYYAEKYLEVIILENVYKQFNYYADIIDVRAAHISNLDSRVEASEKLDQFLLKFYRRCVYFPDMIIISQTLFEYLEASKYFHRFIPRDATRRRLTLEGEYRRANVYVDWFTKDDFLYIGCNETASLRLFYSFRNVERREVELTVWHSNQFEENFSAVLTKSPRDPMDTNMLDKNVEQFIPL